MEGGREQIEESEDKNQIHIWMGRRAIFIEREIFQKGRKYK